MKEMYQKPVYSMTDDQQWELHIFLGSEDVLNNEKIDLHVVAY